MEVLIGRQPGESLLTADGDGEDDEELVQSEADFGSYPAEKHQKALPLRVRFRFLLKRAFGLPWQ